jgi:glycerate kinase
MQPETRVSQGSAINGNPATLTTGSMFSATFGEVRVLVAPDSFKGSLSASAAAEAIARGVVAADLRSSVDLCPLSDGGEGSAEVLVKNLGGEFRSADVMGPLGTTVTARWALLATGVAVVESAEAAGLGLVPESARDPRLTTTFGVGELILAALDAGASSLLVTLGGSGTTDGGAGMAQALGARFVGGATPMTGGRLEGVRAVDTTTLDPRLSNADILAASDVVNPLTGENGAALVYAPQKGASPAVARQLDEALLHLSKLVGDPGTTTGDGAGGGLGYGLRVFAGARPVRGATLILDAARFDERVADATLVITGEGRLDAQSARGKVVSAVCERAARAGVPVIALAGSVDASPGQLAELGLSAAHSLTSGAFTDVEAKARAAELLEALAERVVRDFVARPHVTEK